MHHFYINEFFGIFFIVKFVFVFGLKYGPGLTLGNFMVPAELNAKLLNFFELHSNLETKSLSNCEMTFFLVFTLIWRQNPYKVAVKAFFFLLEFGGKVHP